MKKIYVCGPTVYNDPHIGNLRPIVTFDLMLKAYRALGKKFKFIHNITDVDDKIINKAIEENKTEQEISELYYQKYLQLLNKMNVDTISNIEKVTDNIELIKDYINKLYTSKNAYKDNIGNVWFDVNKNKENYGVVSNQKLDNMEFEEQNQDKQYEADFALWKITTKGIKFDSIFGHGRPGWHTECVALIDKHFGKEGVDVHGGGMDLTFPHHENENIQHFSLFGKNLAKNWLRTGQINLNGIKMSKSLGNIISAFDFIEKYGASLFKIIILSSKFTAHINLTQELIDNMISIEKKYKKLLFKFFTSFFIDELDTKINDKIKEILTMISEGEFSNFNYLLNEEIKEFNRSKSIINAKNIYFILKVIHPELTDINKYKKYIDLYNEWNYFIDKKDYINADKIRDILIKNDLL
ncbi:Cysteine--tRNA ligase [Mycoplasmopsis maculosa]|uniref:Cysteine--tRNA ligase n=1 Tax=Mycoplasmopsis maculosa TaxID=114885 RepID=A0A449B4V8_9BACT|nr:class I tRNA ligase family protein [Mycoplasmopsis maculosa]VEU75644.1 Cysteine--tRNA ligase [Mycoplasmopsis maculosa]